MAPCCGLLGRDVPRIAHVRDPAVRGDGQPSRRMPESGTSCSKVELMTPAVHSAAAAALCELFPALADAAPATLGRIVEHGIHRKVPAGTIMFDAHTPCAGFPLVLSGTIKVLQRYPNGREMPLYRVKPGESCLLSGSCLLGHAEYIATAIPDTDVELVIVPPSDFHALIASD